MNKLVVEEVVSMLCSKSTQPIALKVSKGKVLVGEAEMAPGVYYFLMFNRPNS